VHSWENRCIHGYGFLGLTAFGVLSIRIRKKFIECFLKFLKGFPVDTITGFGSVYGAGDEFGFQQFLEVLRDGGLGQWENFYYFSADAALSPGDFLEDGNPGGMAYGVGKISQLIFLFVEFVFFIRRHCCNVYRKYTIN